MLSSNPTLTFDQLPINNVVIIITWNGQESIAKWKHWSEREPGLQALSMYFWSFSLTNYQVWSIITHAETKAHWASNTTMAENYHGHKHRTCLLPLTTQTIFPSFSSKHFVVSWFRNRLTMKSWNCLMKLLKWSLSNGAWFPPVPRHVLDLLEELRRTGWHTQLDEDQRTPGSSCSFSSSKKIIVPLQWCCCSIASTHDLFI